MSKFKKILLLIGVIFCLVIPMLADETETTLTLTVSDNTMTFASTASGSVSYSSSAQSKSFTGASNANGAVTYSLVSQKQGSTTVTNFSIPNSSTASLNISASTGVGTYTIVIRATAAGDTTHIAKSIDQTYTLTVNKIANTLAFTTPQSGSVTFSTAAQSKAFTAATNGNGAVTYSITAQKNSSNTTVNYFSIPTNSTASMNIAANTPAGTYTITLRASAAGDSTHNSGTKDSTYTLTVNKLTPTLGLSATSGTLTYPNPGTFTVTSNPSGGTLSVSSGTTSVATASISGNTITLTPQAVTSDGQTSVITVTSAAAGSYNAGSATYTVTVNRGTITLTPTALNGTYSGSAQYAKIKSNVGGVTIVSGTSTSYGNSVTTNATANTNYNLLPGYTNYQTSTTIYYKATKAGYKDATGSTTAAIAKASSSAGTPPSAKTGLTYTGSAQALANAASGVTGGTIEYGLGTSTTSGPSSWSSSVPSGTNAGTYYVWYRINGDSNHNSTAATYAATVTIDRASVGAKPTTTASKNYTGSSQNNGYTTPTGVNMTGNNSGTNAGTYTATYTPDSNHKWSDGSTSAVNVTLTINKREVTVTAPSANSSTLTFDGTAKTLATAGSSGNGGTMYYYVSTSSTAPAFSTSTWKTTIDTKTDAGTYYIHYYCYVSDTNNNTSSSSSGAKAINTAYSIQKTINRASAGDKPTNTNVTKTYNGSSQNNGYTKPTNINISGNSSGTAVGEYLATYTPATNYEWSDGTTGSVTVKLTVNAANMTVNAPNQSYAYTGSAQGAAISVTTVGSQTATIRYRTASSGDYTLETAPKATTVADSKTVYYKVTAPNHNDATGSYTLTITKASSSVSTAPTAKSGLSFTGSGQNLVNGGSASGGTIQYKVGTSGTYSSSIPQQTNAGTYNVYYKVVGDANHNDSTEYGPIEVTISKVSSTMTYASQSWTTDFSTSSQTKVVSAAANANGTVSYALQSQSAGNYFTFNSSTRVLTAAANIPAGTHTVVIRATDSGDQNHNSGYKDSTITVTIEKADSSIATVPTINTGLEYTGSAQNLVSGGTATGGTIYYKVGASGTYSSTIPQETNADTYDVYYKVVGDGNHEDSEEYGPISVTIAKTAGTVSYPAQSWSPTYSTSSQTTTLSTAANQNGTATYSLVSQKQGSTDVNYFTFNSSTRVLTLAANTPAGTYTVVVRASDPGDGNHNASTSDSTITVTVGKATNEDFTFPATQTAWDDAKYSDETAVNHPISTPTGAIGTVTYNVTGTGSENFSVSGGNLVMAPETPLGTYNLTITATDSGDANHAQTSKTSTITVTVSKGQNSIVFPEVDIEEIEYDDDDRTITLPTATGGQGTITYEIISQPEGDHFSIDENVLTADEDTPVGTHEVIIRATAEGDDTHEPGFKDMTLTFTVRGSTSITIPSSIDFVTGESVNYSMVGYTLDVTITSQNNWNVVNNGDNVAYTINDDTWTGLTNSGSFDLEFELDNDAPNYSGSYQDILNFEVEFNVIN